MQYFRSYKVFHIYTDLNFLFCIPTHPHFTFYTVPEYASFTSSLISCFSWYAKPVIC